MYNSKFNRTRTTIESDKDRPFISSFYAFSNSDLLLYFLLFKTHCNLFSLFISPSLLPTIPPPYNMHKPACTG